MLIGGGGFLGTRASLMLDIVFVAMFFVLPLLAASVFLVRYRRKYVLHKRLQLGLGLALLATLVVFEVDIRLEGWRHRATPSPYYGPIENPGPVLSLLCLDLFRLEQVPGWVFIVLTIHLLFAVTTAILWIAVFAQALRKFPRRPMPGVHSRCHVFWGQLAVADMGFTALTGWLFYWLAFVAS